MEVKVEKFDVVICNKASGEIYEVLAATIETEQGQALREKCEARVVPSGKFKKGERAT